MSKPSYIPKFILNKSSLPIQLYLVDSFVYAASAVSAASVSRLTLFYSYQRHDSHRVVCANSFSARCSDLPFLYSVNECSILLGWEAVVLYVLLSPLFSCELMTPTISVVGGGRNRPWNSLSRLDLLQGSTDACGKPSDPRFNFAEEKLMESNALSLRPMIRLTIDLLFPPRTYPPRRLCYINIELVNQINSTPQISTEIINTQGPQLE